MYLSVRSTRRGHSRASLAYWRGRTTEAIVKSFEPGTGSSLVVKVDGPIMDGNTRIHVLRERGFNVDRLPRQPYESA